MSLVTPQGMQARERVNKRTSVVRDQLLRLLTAEELTVGEILAKFPDDSEQVVREAIWRVLNDRQAEVDRNRRLHPIHA
jgi:hypothetical protein